MINRICAYPNQKTVFRTTVLMVRYHYHGYVELLGNASRSSRFNNWRQLLLFFFNKIETCSWFSCFSTANRLQCCFCCIAGMVTGGEPAGPLPLPLTLLFAAPCGHGGAVPVFGLNLLCLLSWKQLDVKHWLSSAGTGVRPSWNSIRATCSPVMSLYACHNIGTISLLYASAHQFINVFPAAAIISFPALKACHCFFH